MKCIGFSTVLKFCHALYHILRFDGFIGNCLTSWNSFGTSDKSLWKCIFSLLLLFSVKIKTHLKTNAKVILFNDIHYVNKLLFSRPHPFWSVFSHLYRSVEKGLMVDMLCTVVRHVVNVVKWHLYTHVHMHACTHTHTHIYTRIHTYTHTHKHACPHTHMYTYTCEHAHIHAYTQTHTHTHARTHTNDKKSLPQNQSWITFWVIWDVHYFENCSPC